MCRINPDLQVYDNRNKEINLQKIIISIIKTKRRPRI